MAVRPRFDPKRPLVAARDFTFHGQKYEAGHAFGPFDPGLVSDRMRARQYEARRVNFGEGEQPADQAPADPVTMTGPAGGRYTITAPWLEEPEVVRGKVNAEKRLAELRETGAPLGFIEGGSAVTVEGGEGGWYEVNAPWLDEPEKVRGREAAETRQVELHEAGEPDSHSGFTLKAGENGWYAITKDDDDAELPTALNVQGEDKARKIVAQLRAGETPEGTALPVEWEPKELDPVEGYAATVLVQQDGDTFTVTAGGRDPETFDKVEDAEARQAELRAGEPPDGWTPEARPDVEGAGNEAPEDETVDDSKDQKTGDAPNEPGTNEPNGAEVINDETNSEANQTGDDGEGGGGTDGGDGTTGTVGP